MVNKKISRKRSLRRKKTSRKVSKKRSLRRKKTSRKVSKKRSLRRKKSNSKKHPRNLKKTLKGGTLSRSLWTPEDIDRRNIKEKEAWEKQKKSKQTMEMYKDVKNIFQSCTRWPRGSCSRKLIFHPGSLRLLNDWLAMCAKIVLETAKSPRPTIARQGNLSVAFTALNLSLIHI